MMMTDPVAATQQHPSLVVCHSVLKPLGLLEVVVAQVQPVELPLIQLHLSLQSLPAREVLAQAQAQKAEL